MPCIAVILATSLLGAAVRPRSEPEKGDARYARGGVDEFANQNGQESHVIILPIAGSAKDRQAIPGH
jgi:hypothetical protein